MEVMNTTQDTISTSAMQDTFRMNDAFFRTMSVVMLMIGLMGTILAIILISLSETGHLWYALAIIPNTMSFTIGWCYLTGLIRFSPRI